MATKSEMRKAAKAGMTVEEYLNQISSDKAAAKAAEEAAEKAARIYEEAVKKAKANRIAAEKAAEKSAHDKFDMLLKKHREFFSETKSDDRAFDLFREYMEQFTSRGMNYGILRLTLDCGREIVFSQYEGRKSLVLNSKLGVMIKGESCSLEKRSYDESYKMFDYSDRGGF